MLLGREDRLKDSATWKEILRGPHHRLERQVRGSREGPPEPIPRVPGPEERGPTPCAPQGGRSGDRVPHEA